MTKQELEIALLNAIDYLEEITSYTREYICKQIIGTDYEKHADLLNCLSTKDTKNEDIIMINDELLEWAERQDTVLDALEDDEIEWENILDSNETKVDWLTEELRHMIKLIKKDRKNGRYY